MSVSLFLEKNTECMIKFNFDFIFIIYVTDSEQENRKQHVFMTRYLTYLGLCIATCIILQRSIYLAAVVGLAVATYISVSEYILNTPPTLNTSDLAQQLMQAAT